MDLGATPPGVEQVYNRVILVGRLTRDPDLRHTPQGKAVAHIRLAVDRGVSNQQGERQTDFIDVSVWDRQAETVSQYLRKGRLVLVEGRLQVRQYDASDGTRRTVYEVVASAVKFFPQGRSSEESPPAERPPGREAEPFGDIGTEFTPGDDDDIPF